MRAFLSLSLLLIALLAGACSWPFAFDDTHTSGDDTLVPRADDQLLMTASFTGGHCVYGACDGQVTVYTGGTYVMTNGSGAEQTDLLTASLITNLMLEIEAADYDAIRSQPFTDICPIAYDGQQVTYTFYTSGGEET